MYAGALSLLMASAGPLAAQLTLRVRLPENTPAGATIYAAGTFNQWDPAAPAYRLDRVANGEFVLTLPNAVRGPVQFKFTLGSWDTAEVDSAGGDVPNRTFTVPARGAATHRATVAGWRDASARPPLASTARPSVAVLDTAFPVPQLGRSRRVWIYLPPDYAATNRRYPVLYMHDGQNVFDDSSSFAGEWGVDESLDSLYALGDRGAIVVAVDNGGERRLDEYSPWKNPRHGGGEGDAYVDFLVRTLKPYIDRHFRTCSDRLHTGVMGSSMGGLISLHAALRYPQTFGRVGVFSPAFWFADSIYTEARQDRPLRPDPRFFFLTGAREGEDPEVYIRDHRRMVDTLVEAGFRRGTEVRELVRPDGVHAEWFWRQEFPAGYRWLFEGSSAACGVAPG